MYGVGTDIIEIRRIAEACKKPGFIDRCFTAGEQALFREDQRYISRIAGNFAAKEAIVKAIGTGIGAIGWKDIEVLRDALGKPYVVLSAQATEVAARRGIGTLHISISHCKTYAVAFCMAEQIQHV